MDYWKGILDSIEWADADNTILTPANFSDDYKLIVIIYEATIDNELKSVYLVAQYRKVESWYKKSVKFGFTTNTFEAKNEDIFVLNGCIDAAIFDNEVYVLQERQFENIFNFYEKSKSKVETSRPHIEKWFFIDNPAAFYDSVNGKKTPTIKLARALEKVRLDLTSLTPEKVKSTLSSYEEFSEITYDKENRIVFTSGVRDLIIDIAICAYARGLFNDDVVYTKGV